MNRLRFMLAFAVALPAFLAFTVEINAQDPANFVVLHQGYYALTFTKKQTRVITSQEEYTEALAVYSPDEPRELDFNLGRVLLVDMGRRSTGGFSIDVAGVEQMRASVRVAVQLTRPGAACFVTQSLTNPYQFIYIPTRKEILVSESLTTFACGNSPGAISGQPR